MLLSLLPLIISAIASAPPEADPVDEFVLLTSTDDHQVAIRRREIVAARAEDSGTAIYTPVMTFHVKEGPVEVANALNPQRAGDRQAHLQALAAEVQNAAAALLADAGPGQQQQEGEPVSLQDQLTRAGWTFTPRETPRSEEEIAALVDELVPQIAVLPHLGQIATDVVLRTALARILEWSNPDGASPQVSS